MRHIKKTLSHQKFASFLCVITALIVGLIAFDAHAIPAFAEQTGQPCAQCHVGAFGPQLKPYGRDFKLYGYTASDGENICRVLL